jgi:hypothetical protein
LLAKVAGELGSSPASGRAVNQMISPVAAFHCQLPIAEPLRLDGSDFRRSDSSALCAP